MPHRLRGTLSIRHHQAGRVPVAKPRERLAARPRAFLALRPAACQPPRHADVLPRRSADAVRPDPQLDPRCRADASCWWRASTSRPPNPPGLSPIAGTSSFAAATRRRWKADPVAGRRCQPRRRRSDRSSVSPSPSPATRTRWPRGLERTGSRDRCSTARVSRSPTASSRCGTESSSRAAAPMPRARSTSTSASRPRHAARMGGYERRT